MRRSAGIILSQILLAVFALCNLLLMLGMLLSAAASRSQIPAPAAPTGLLLASAVAASLFFAALAAWAITTIVGLARLRSWARYSILILGGCLAAFGLLLSLGSLAVRTIMPAILAQQPNQPPQMASIMATAIVVMAVLYALVAAVGIGWLIFFNLRTTRALFEAAPPPLGDPTLPPPPPGRFAHIPTPVLVLACLYAISAVTSAIAACLHFPAFAAGFILTGASMHILFLVMATCSGCIAYGLFRLDNWARIAALAFAALGAVNLALSTLPYYRARMHDYADQITASMGVPATPGAINPVESYPFTLFTLGIGALMLVAFVWILIHYRGAFHSAKA